MPLPKPCRDCQEMFNPEGKYCYYCKKCLTIRNKYKYIKRKKVDSKGLKTPKTNTPVQTTTPIIPRANRCTECGKTVRHYNKSLLCAFHYNIKRSEQIRLTRRINKLETIELNMKKEEVQYLTEIKKKNGSSQDQIIKELERDIAFQEKLKKLKKAKMKTREKILQECKETNKQFKEEFAKLK